MCVHWYFAKHFPELSYHFLTRSKGRIFNELRVSFNYWELLFQKVFIPNKFAKTSFESLTTALYLLDVSPWINHFIDKNLG